MPTRWWCNLRRSAVNNSPVLLVPMSKLAPKTKSAASWVLEIGASHVAAGEFRKSAAGGVALSQLAFREVGTVGDSEMDESAAAEAMRDVADSIRPRGAVTLVLPGHHVITKLVRVPEGAEAQRERLIAFEAGQALPFSLDELYWSHRLVGNHDGECEVLVVAAKRGVVERWVSAVQGAGIEVGTVVSAGLSAMAALPPSTEGTGQVFINIGARSTHLVFREGARFQIRTLALAGQTVSRRIADQLEQGFSAAEQLKRGVFGGMVDLPGDTPAGAVVAQAAETFCARLKLELNRSLVTQVRQNGMTAPAHLWLAGGGAIVPGLAEALAQRDSLEISDWPVDLGCEVAASARDEFEQLRPGRLADLMGAGITEVWGRPVCDLAPPALRAGREAKRQRPRWLIAAALLAFAALLPGWHFQRLTNARLQAVQELQRQAVPVQALRDQNQQRLDELRRLERVVEVLGQRVEARDAWEGLLADLQAGLVQTGDVWLERLQVMPAESGDATAEVTPRLRVRISGRLLDRENPLSRVSQASFQRATQLIDSLLQSPQVDGIEGERFDAGDPGILRFDFTLVMNPRSHL